MRAVQTLHVDALAGLWMICWPAGLQTLHVITTPTGISSYCVDSWVARLLTIVAAPACPCVVAWPDGGCGDLLAAVTGEGWRGVPTRLAGSALG